MKAKLKTNRNESETGPPRKIFKKDDKKPPRNPKETKSKFSKNDKTPQKDFTRTINKDKFKAGRKFEQKPSTPLDWVEYKQMKKEVQLKRKQSKNLFEVITTAKQIGEKLRLKKLEGGTTERGKLVKELHAMLGGQGNYIRFVLAHDMARIVQYLLKFGNEEIRNEVSKELIPATVDMLQSKYGKFCIKRLLQYGNSEIRSGTIKAMYGNAVKLTSHAISAPVFEYAYSTWGQPLEKTHLIQEFFGDMYKQSKDDNIKHLRDVYKNSADMKTAALGATKANLSRILNKNLLDSGLVQSVLSQFLTECTVEDRTELIAQLAPHVVILSNSKDGARVVMQCIWNGTNKDRKVAMKALKENVIELCKHEHGHTTMIALLDAVDDTVLVNKMIISVILNQALEIASNEWGRKVLLWLVTPADSTYFHPTFIKELEMGRDKSTCKKSPSVRRKELLDYTTNALLANVASQANLWLATASISVVALAILKTGSGEELRKALKSVVKVIIDPDWTVKENEVETAGIEHAGLHMTLKKLCQHDKVSLENGNRTFGEELMKRIDDDIIRRWIKLNRSCFLLIMVFENCSQAVQDDLKAKLEPHLDEIKQQSSTGAKILIKKIK